MIVKKIKTCLDLSPGTSNIVVFVSYLLGDGGSEIASVNELVVRPPLFEAWTVKLKFPIAVGVPEITPAVESVNPPGSAPLNIDHEIGAVPSATKVTLYGVPVVPPVSEVVVIVGGMGVVALLSAGVAQSP